MVRQPSPPGGQSRSSGRSPHSHLPSCLPQESRRLQPLSRDSHISLRISILQIPQPQWHWQTRHYLKRRETLEQPCKWAANLAPRPWMMKSPTLSNTGTVDSTSIGIGDPPTHCGPYQVLHGIIFYSDVPISDNLVLDTWSTNTWMGANKEYQATSSSVKTGDIVVRIASRTDS